MIELILDYAYLYNKHEILKYCIENKHSGYEKYSDQFI